MYNMDLFDHHLNPLMSPYCAIYGFLYFLEKHGGQRSCSDLSAARLWAQHAAIWSATPPAGDQSQPGEGCGPDGEREARWLRHDTRLSASVFLFFCFLFLCWRLSVSHLRVVLLCSPQKKHLNCWEEPSATLGWSWLRHSHYMGSWRMLQPEPMLQLVSIKVLSHWQRIRQENNSSDFKTYWSL